MGRSLAGAMLLAVAAVLGACDGEPPKTEHVFLIVVDTLRADHLGAFGYERPTSPHIDRLAREGVLFEQAIAQASFTSPSMVSLMTGHYIARERASIPAELTTLAESFHQAGFATGGFSSNGLISRDNGFARGFETFEAIEEYGSNDAIARWLESVRGKKSFTYVQITEPHDEHGEYLAKKGPSEWREAKIALPGDREQYYERAVKELGLADGAASIDRIRTEIGGYDDEVRAADRRVGELLELFERNGLRERGLVVLTADHGEGLWEHVALLNGQRGAALRRGETPTLLNTLMPTHGNQVHHELVHVPLILAGAGLPKGEVVSAPVENVSLYPTLLELCDIAGPDKLQGRSLLRWIEGEPPVDHAFSFTKFNTTVIDSDGMALILPSDEGECGEGLALQLFDLKKDPHQRVDLSAEKPQVVARLRELAQRRLEQGIQQYDPINDQTLVALRQLGYVDQVEREEARRQIEAMPTAEILAKIVQMIAPCSERLMGVEALAKRELDESAREALRLHRAKETSKDVIRAIDAILR